jgi:cytochrome c553
MKWMWFMRLRHAPFAPTRIVHGAGAVTGLPCPADQNRAMFVKRSIGLAAAALIGNVAMAQDAVRGAALYRTLPGNPGVGACFSCHGEPVNNRNSVLRGANGAALIARTIGAVSAMGYLRQYLSDADLTDIAAYLATIVPAGPIESLPELSPTSDAFGAQLVGTVSAPREILVRNRRSTGEQPIGAVIAADPVQWLIEHDCPIALPPLGQCRVRVAFRPAAVGPVAGSFGVYDAGGLLLRSGALAGIGVTEVPAALGWEAVPDFAFGTVAVAAVAQRTAVLLNHSVATAVSLERLRVTGPNASRFRLDADCLATRRLEPGGRCTVQLTFAPAGAGLAEGWVEIESDASAPALARVSATAGAAPAMADPAPETTAPPGGGASGAAWLAALAAALFGLRRR